MIKLHELCCSALMATPEEKEKIWENLIDPKNSLSNRALEYSLMGFGSHSTAEEAKKYSLRWIKVLPFVFKNCKREFFKSFTGYLQPS